MRSWVSVAATVAAVVFLAADGSAQSRDTVIRDASNGENLYRSYVHKFRIRFPARWQVKNGDGPNVQKKATFRGSTILVLVKDLTTPDAVEDLRARVRQQGQSISAPDALALIRQEMNHDRLKESDYPAPNEGLEKFSNVEIVEHSMRRLDNRAARYVRVRMSYTAGDITVRMEQFGYSLFVAGKIYNVQASAPLADVATRRAQMEKSLRTFVIENW